MPTASSAAVRGSRECWKKRSSDVPGFAAEIAPAGTSATGAGGHAPARYAQLASTIAKNPAPFYGSISSQSVPDVDAHAAHFQQFGQRTLRCATLAHRRSYSNPTVALMTLFTTQGHDFRQWHTGCPGVRPNGTRPVDGRSTRLAGLHLGHLHSNPLPVLAGVPQTKDVDHILHQFVTHLVLPDDHAPHFAWVELG